MKPPLLQTAWANRVFRPAGGRGDWHESFLLAVVSPDGRQALWIDLTLDRSDGDDSASVGVVWAASAGQPPATVRRTFAADAVGIDPERAGLGIAESSLGDGACAGRVADADGSVTWRLTWAAAGSPYAPLPPPTGRLGRWLAPQWCAPLPFATVAGEVEFWSGHGNHRPVRRVALDGWQAVQTHRWGAGPPLAYAMLAAAAPPATQLIAVALPLSAGPWGGRQRVVGRLWRAGAADQAFDGWRSLKDGQSHLHAAAWAFTVPGPTGALRARADLPPAVGPGEAMGAAGHRRLVTHAAGLQVDLRPPGGSWEGNAQRLELPLALCEVVAPAS